MIYIKIVADTMYCGTQNIYLHTFEGDIISPSLKKLLDDMTSEIAEENGESYAWDVAEEDYEEYIEDCYALSYWTEISEEEYNELKEEGW